MAVLSDVTRELLDAWRSFGGWVRRRLEWVLDREQGFADRVRRFFERRGWSSYGRHLVWLTVALAAVSFVMLKDANTLLRSVEGAGVKSYDANVFTGFTVKPWDIDDLQEAQAFWRCADEGAAGSPETCEGAATSEEDHAPVRRFLQAHLLIDLFLYVPAYCLLLWFTLAAVGIPAAFARRSAEAVFLADLAETAFTLFALSSLDAGEGSLMAIHFLSLAKWGAIAAALIAVVASSFNNENGGWSIYKALGEIGKARRGGQEHPAIALSGLILVTSIFAAFVALPAGSVLDQIPDVLRYQVFRIGTGEWRLMFASGGALLALGVALVLSGFVATDWTTPPSLPFPEHKQSQWVQQSMEQRVASPRENPAPDWAILSIAGGVSLFLFFVAYGFDGEWSISPFASVVVCAVISIVALLARSSRLAVDVQTAAPEDDGPAEQPADPVRERTLWVGGVAGLALMAGGIGVVRAAFAPFLLEQPGDTIPWWLGDTWLGITLLGAATALIAGIVAQEFALRLDAFRSRHWRAWTWWTAGIAFSVLIAWIAWRMAYDPRFAHHFGMTGVAAMCMAFFALLLGAASWVSRRAPRWEATGTLGLGVRTPWVTLLVVTAVVASLLDTGGGYHNARVAEGYSAPEPEHASLVTAFEDWRDAQPSEEECGSGPVPMVLVAAPGGGIKAAYWTERSLEALFGGEDAVCARPRIFAMSSVSGGSLGVTTWVAATSHDGASADAAINGMADDKALSAAIAGLLLRDLPQPLTGISSAWRDRAALLEDDWIDSSGGALGSLDEPLAWSDIGGDEAWTPIVILGGSSVNDGCRVLTSNTGGLPATTAGQSCYAAPDGGGAAGPVSGALDPFEDCRADTTQGAPQRLNGMRAATAVLLSARFPVISPSGAIARCLPGQTPDRATTYVVDGGYYENSGLMALLQVWSEIEPMARAGCDDAQASAAPADRFCAEPWFVVLDNSYRSRATGAEPGRPNELMLILQTQGRLKETISSRAFEQMAAWAVDGRTAVADGATADVSPPACANLVHLGLTRRPAIAAPLGWVLSEVSRRNLDAELRRELDHEGTPLATLRTRLRGEPADAECE